MWLPRGSRGASKSWAGSREPSAKNPMTAPSGQRLIHLVRMSASVSTWWITFVAQPKAALSSMS